MPTRRTVLGGGVAAIAALAAADLVAEPAGASDPVRRPTPSVQGLPGVVPSVQEATPGSGTGFTWTGEGRIVVDDSAGGPLTANAETFATDLAGMFGGVAPPVVDGAPDTAKPGDISLALGNTDDRLGDEGYGMSIGPVLAISAPTETGAFWGTRTALQLLRQQTTLPATTIADWPRYKVRAILVSRTGFPAGWYVNMVRDMSYVKLNAVMTHSWLGELTDEQIVRIREVADQYHVNFVGWFNSTHYDRDKVPPEEHWLQVLDKPAGDGGKVRPDKDTLDISEPAGVEWATGQMAHYMQLQTAPLWHAGGDEYPKHFLRNRSVTAQNAPDLHAAAVAKYPSEQYPAAAVYNEVFNQIDELAKSHGKQMWIWNDDLYPTEAVPLNPDIVVDHWYGRSGAIEPAQLIEAGHHLINSNADYLYYNQDRQDLPNTTAEILWNDLDPGVFHTGLRIPEDGDNPNLDGIKLSVWNSGVNMAPGLLELELLERDRPLAERAWTIAEPTVPIGDAQALFAKVGRAAGVLQTPVSGDPGQRSLVGSPALGYRGSQQVFFADENGQLYHRFRQSGRPDVGEEALQTTAPVTGRPLAYVPTNDTLHVFVLGTNGKLQHTWYTPSTNTWRHDEWSGPSGVSLEGNLAGFAYGAQQHVFARGTDQHLYHVFYDPTAGQVRTEDWGGDVAGDPVAYVWGAVQNVFAVGSDGALHQWWWQPSDTGSADAARVQYRNLGGSFAAEARPFGAAFLVEDAEDPFGVQFVQAVQDVVVRDTDNHLRLWSYDHFSGTEAWQDLTTQTSITVAGNPIEYVYGTGEDAVRDIFVRNADNNHLVHITIQPDGSVSNEDWTTIAIGDPDTAVDDPIGFNFTNTERHVYATDPAGKMHHWYWQASDGQVHQDNWPA